MSLDKSISDAYKSIRTAATLLLFATLGCMLVGLSGVTSPFVLPILSTVMFGNQVYLSRTRNMQKKLNTMKKVYDSRFGAFVSLG